MEESPVLVEAEDECEPEVDLTICRISGSQDQVKIRLSVTVDQFKEALVHTNVVQGLLAFKLMMTDGTLLKDGTARLSDCGLCEGSAVMVVFGRTRDYTKIKEFDKVLCNGRYPQGVLTNDSGELFVCYYYGELKVFGPDYKPLREYRLPHSAPTQMAFAPTGELLIAFSGEPVGVFDPSDMKLLRWLGDRHRSNGIAVSGDRLFRADSSGGTILVYSLSSGELLATWAGFAHPCGLVVLEEDQMLAVADRRNDRVALLDFDGSLVKEIGCGEAPARLQSPNDVAVDPDGNLLVLDTNNERIAVFDRDGLLLASVMPGFFKNRGNTYSYLSVNQVTGAVSVSFDDEHRVVILAPLFPAV